MSKKIKSLQEKIIRRNRKLIKACLRRDDIAIIKHQHKLLRLNLKLAND